MPRAKISCNLLKAYNAWEHGNHTFILLQLFNSWVQKGVLCFVVDNKSQFLSSHAVIQALIVTFEVDFLTKVYSA